MYGTTELGPSRPDLEWDQSRWDEIWKNTNPVPNTKSGTRRGITPIPSHAQPYKILLKFLSIQFQYRWCPVILMVRV